MKIWILCILLFISTSCATEKEARLARLVTNINARLRKVEREGEHFRREIEWLKAEACQPDPRTPKKCRDVRYTAPPLPENYLDGDLE